MTVAPAFLALSGRRWLWTVLAVVGLALARGGAADTPEPRTLIVPELPAWIHPPLGLPPAPELATTSPVRMMIVEEQTDVERKASFRHYAMRVESESGLQSAGQVALSYSKDYETLQWHFLRVWRDGVKRELLAPELLQVLRQEEDADRFVYHGRLSVLAVLRDVRVGDIVEYAYTKTGANPVFAGRYSTRFAGAFGSPVDLMSYRVVAAAGRPLHVAPLGAFQPDHRTATVEGRVEHAWTAAKLAPVRPLGDAPDWEVQYPFVQLTEFASWQEVADWGRELFAAPPALSAELLARVAEVTKGLTSDEAKAGAVLRFVQDEMRYLAVHLGESTHRPYLPDEVFLRRFGDCKDKSLLLVALLRHLGFKAHVALVHSEWGRTVADLQPSPLAFDHAIVHVVLPGQARAKASLIPEPALSSPLGPGGSLLLKKLPAFDSRLSPPTTDLATFPPARDGASLRFESAEEDLWLDATSTLQGGPLAERQHGNFGYALVLGPDATRLRRVEPMTEPGNVVHVRETYHAKNFDAPARLDVTTTYRGGMADFYRYYRRQSDPAQAAQQLTGVLGRLFPGVKSLGPIEWNDDRGANTLTARASFDVPGFWSVEADGKVRAAEVYPWGISERLPRPESTERTVSFALSYPVKVTHEIELILPKDWPEAAGRSTVEDDTFQFRAVTEGKGDRVRLVYDWRTRAEAVPAARMGEWSKKMSEVRGLLGYKVTQNIRLAAEMKRQGIVWPMAAAVGVGALAGLALGIWLYRRPGRPKTEPPPLGGTDLVGIAGWLMLPALALTLRPFLLLKGIWPTVALMVDRPSWIAATDGESVGYISGFYAVALAEGLIGALFVAWAAVLLPQFFRRKESLPLSFVVHLIGFAVWGAIHVVWLRQVPLPDATPLATDISEVVKLFGVAAIWVPYFLVSRRVKLTFTR